MKPRKPIRKISKKRSRNNLEYQKAKMEYMEEHPVCEACIASSAHSLHHKKGRGIYLSDEKFFMAVCNLCHHKIELNRKWAYEMGFLIDRLGHD